MNGKKAVSPSNKFRNKLALVTVPILIGIMHFVACNSDYSLGPTDFGKQEIRSLMKSGKGSSNNNPYPNSELLIVRKREDNEGGVSTAIIGPAGGVLVHADHRLVVPPGALSAPVQLSFSIPVSDTLMFEFKPDGIQFNQPVQVVLSYDHTYKNGLNENLFQVKVWDVALQSWQQIPTSIDTELDEATGLTTHFSRYAISKR